MNALSMALIAVTAGGFSQVMILRLPETELELPVEVDVDVEVGVELEELQAAPSTVIAMASEPAITGLPKRNDMGLLLTY
jgi:hypothetical protein